MNQAVNDSATGVINYYFNEMQKVVKYLSQIFDQSSSNCLYIRTKIEVHLSRNKMSTLAMISKNVKSISISMVHQI